MALFAGALFFSPSASPFVSGILAGVLLSWLLGGLFLASLYFQKKSPDALAKRADRVLGLRDDLLTLSETDSGQSGLWQKASEKKTEQRMAALDLQRDWPVGISRAAVGTLGLAILLTAGVAWLGGSKLILARQEQAQQETARQVRVAAAQEVLKDWKDFVQLTDDQELKKLFTEARGLEEAVQNKDPMAAMLEMNRIEEKMTALEAAIEKDSLAPQAGQIAEALEAFEGMSAMSAALRNKDFAVAESEAGKLNAKLASDPKGKSDLRRDAAVAEMLSAEAKKASDRGNQDLSEALAQMCKAATTSAGKGSVPNEQITAPAKSLQGQFDQENSRQNRGRAAGIAKNQLENLRRGLRGEKEGQLGMSTSLCESFSGKSGLKAGSSPGGEPRGEATELAAAGVQESLSGVQGDGESETRSLNSTTGVAGSTAAAKPMAISDYVELSKKAVQDENIPLAHRQVIRSYFERIRPVTESPTP
jgi:hypothetical protein